MYQIIYKQCWLWNCVPARTFSVFDIVLSANLFPDNAIINPMLLPSEPEGIESGNITIYWEIDGILHGSSFNIDRFGTEQRAKDSFESLQYWRSRDSYNIHPEITYKSQIADDYVVGCGTSMFNNSYKCSLEARYQEYVVTFHSSISNQMSEERFEQVVISIDKQMTSYLGQK